MALTLFAVHGPPRAHAALEFPAYDLFGSDEKIARRSQKLVPDSCPELPKPEEPMKLMEVINQVLCHNPSTRASWLSLRATAAGNTAAKANLLLPNVSANASLSKSKTQLNNGSFISRGSSAGINLSYLLFDFGVREANLIAAEESLIASTYSYDSSLQGVIGSTLRLYYSILSAQGSYDVARESFKFAKESLMAARNRYDLGLVPRSDLLQAETSFAQSELSVQQAENAFLSTIAQLAVAMGLSPQTRLTITDVDDSDLARDNLTVAVEELMDAAEKNRVDLAASEAGLRGARANLDATRRSDLPRVSLNAGQSFGDIDIFNRDTARSGTIGVNVSIPLFTGLTRPYNIRAAEDSFRAQELQMEATRLSIRQDVWQSYTNYKTADQSWMVSWDALASATELRDITLARYKEGIGSFLDVLSAQASYRSAVQSHISARYNLLTTRADLVRSIGVLNLNTAAANAPVNELRETR